jgi:hypothetical protein
MFSDAPQMAAAPNLVIADKVQAFIAVAQIKAKGGLTVAEFGELFLALMRIGIEAVDALNAAGDQKKALVLEALDDLFEALADKAVPLYAYPFWVIARPAIKAAVMAAASGAIEVVLSWVRRSK